MGSPGACELNLNLLSISGEYSGLPFWGVSNPAFTTKTEFPPKEIPTNLRFIQFMEFAFQTSLLFRFSILFLNSFNK